MTDAWYGRCLQVIYGVNRHFQRRYSSANLARGYKQASSAVWQLTGVASNVGAITDVLTATHCLSLGVILEYAHRGVVAYAYIDVLACNRSLHRGIRLSRLLTKQPLRQNGGLTTLGEELAPRVALIMA